MAVVAEVEAATPCQGFDLCAERVRPEPDRRPMRAAQRLLGPVAGRARHEQRLRLTPVCVVRALW
jgi:hypothetical protein